MATIQPPPMPAGAPPNDVLPAIAHLPRTLEALARLSDEEKIMLAAATASGCDAVAYYKPDERDGFLLDKHIALYPGVKNVFDRNMEKYTEGTFATNAAVARNKTYHIPVRTQDGTLKGIIVLHAPDTDYSRVQTPQESSTPYDVHEPALIRKAKLEMAAHIIDRHQDLFGISGELLKKRERRHKTLEEKLDYFTQLTKDMFATLPTKNGETLQPDAFDSVKMAKNADELKAALRKISARHDMAEAGHLLGVGDIMRLSVDALNKGTPEDKPIVSRDQAYLLELLALLHDVGKAQMSFSFFRHWQSPVPVEEQQKRERYAFAENHNHPLFTLLTQLFYQQEGMTAALHHQSLGRYTAAELQEKFGDTYKKYDLLNDDVPPERLPVLSRMMRVADVAEAKSDDERSDKPLDVVLLELAQQAGYNPQTGAVSPVPINASTIDPDCLCFLIDNGVLNAYGEQRSREEKESHNKKGWWSNTYNRPKYDAQAVDAASKQILAAFGWAGKKERVEKELRQRVADDPVIRENSPPAPDRRRGNFTEQFSINLTVASLQVTGKGTAI